MVRFTLPVPAHEIYDAWLDSQKHSAMTGSPATASRQVEGEFTAWNGYIRGKNLLLIDNQKIVQSWRSADFPEEAADSVLSVRLTERQNLTEVEIEHCDIPPGFSVQYQSGWIEFYANPMQKYFAAMQQKKPEQQRTHAALNSAKTRKKKSAVPKKRTIKKTIPLKKKKAAAPVKKKVVKTKKNQGRVKTKGR